MRIFLSASRSGVSRRDSCLQRLEEFTWRGVQPNQISSTYLPAARRPRRTAGKKLAREIDLWDDVEVAPETCTELGEDLSVALLLTRDRVSMSKKTAADTRGFRARGSAKPLVLLQNLHTKYTLIDKRKHGTRYIQVRLLGRKANWKFDWFENGVPPGLFAQWAASAEHHGNIWQCPAIVAAWENTVAAARGKRQVLLVARHPSGSTLLYPLYVHSKRIGWAQCSVVEPLGGASQFDYQDPLVIDGSVTAEAWITFWRGLRLALPKKFGRHYELNLYRVSTGNLNNSTHCWHSTSAPFIDLTRVNSLQDFLVTRGKKLREYVLRGLERVRRMGTVSMSLIGEPDLSWHFSLFCEMYEAQWSRRSAEHALQHPEIRACWRALAAAAAARRKLHFSVFAVNGEPWSYHLGFEHRQILLWYKPTYNIKFATHSPGTLHLALTVQHAVEQGIKTLDLGCGTEEYKRRWTDRCIPLWSLRALGGAASTQDLVRRTKGVLRQTAKRVLTVCGKS